MLHRAFGCGLFLLAVAAVKGQFVCDVGSGETFLDKSQRFVLDQLALSPVEAGQTGYHQHNGVSLDTQLDDSSPQSIATERSLLLAGQECFAAISGLSAEDAADLALLRDNIESSLFQLDRVQSFRYQPQGYVEMIGSGLFFPLTLKCIGEAAVTAGASASFSQASCTRAVRLRVTEASLRLPFHLTLHRPPIWVSPPLMLHSLIAFRRWGILERSIFLMCSRQRI
jgi:hypothetical protein